MSRFNPAAREPALEPAPLPGRRERTPPPAMPTATAMFAVLQLAEVLTEADAFYHHGVGNGDTTHWGCLDVLWTWLKKEITAITGYPNHGKSRFILAVMLIKAAISDWKFAVYVPENEDDFFVELAQMLVGRTANLKFKDNRMSFPQLSEAITWLHAHFFVVTAPEGCTPEQLLGQFALLHEQHGLDGILIDPWNQLSHDFQSREDLYLSAEFSRLKRFAIKHKLAVLVTAHPAGQVKEKGKLLRPDAYSISGGKMWNNKYDNVMAVFRPAFPDPEVELHVHKIKKRGRVGEPGMLDLTYDLKTSRYRPQFGDGTHPLETVSFNAPGTKPDDAEAATWADSKPHAGLSNANFDTQYPT